MKRIISLIIAFTIALACFGVCYGASDFSELLSIEAVENTSNLSNPIKKAEFAYSVAKLMGSGKLAAKDTRYSDVTVENPYSGYIDYLAIYAVVDNTEGISFNPDGFVSVDMANKMLVNALGYGKLAEYSGGYPTGYSSVAVSIGLLDSTEFADDSKITKNEAYKMIDNALNTEMASSGNHANEGWDPTLKSNETPLSKKFEISVYYGIIEKANLSENTVKFSVDSNKFDSNPKLANRGEVLHLSAAGSVDIAMFEHVPSEVWVKDDKIVFIKERKNVSVKYLAISSINDKTSKESLFSASSINEICFYDDEEEYDFAEDGVVYYNGVKEDKSVSLVGNVCKVVFSNDEITAVETWEFSEGGIISEIVEDTIKYKNNEGKILSLKEIEAYKNLRVIINGRGAEFTEIKANSVFDYWKDENSLVIMVNEEIVSDVFESYSASNVKIGNAIYYVDDVYYTEDGKTYTKNSGQDKLLGTFVNAYFAPNGKIRYIEFSDKEAAFTEFYALARGVQEDTMEENEAVIKMLSLDGTSSIIYGDVDKKTVFAGTSLAELKNVNDENLSQGVYLFTTNLNGKITRVEKASRLFGFEDDYQTPTTFINSLNTFSAGGKYLYFDGIPVTVLYKIDEEMIAKQVQFDKTLAGRQIGTNATMSFFAKPDELTPGLILLWGDVSTIGKAARQYGIFLEKAETVGENGEKMYEITVFQETGKQKYKVTPQTAEKLTERSFIMFYKDLMFSKDEIALYSAPISVASAPSDWETVTTATGFKSGRIVRANSKMLVVDTFDELGNVSATSAFPAHPSQSFFMEYDERNINNQFSLISADEINEGDTVFFYYVTDGVRMVIVVR